MEKQNLDWGSLGFGYVKTDKRYVANFKNGHIWYNNNLYINRIIHGRKSNTKRINKIKNTCKL